MPYFEPFLRTPYLFKKDSNLRSYLLTKLINAEYSSLKAPAFSTYSEKSIEHSLSELTDLLENLTFTFVEFHPNSNENNSGPLPSQSFTIQAHSPSSLINSGSTSSISSFSNTNSIKQVIPNPINTSNNNNSLLSMKNAFKRINMLQVFTNSISNKNTSISEQPQTDFKSNQIVDSNNSSLDKIMEDENIEVSFLSTFFNF